LTGEGGGIGIVGGKYKQTATIPKGKEVEVFQLDEKKAENLVRSVKTVDEKGPGED